ncbi:MAG: 30S ribosomal protein S6 [Phycisphaerae bacterium]|nr:30S ribosomal protein S6 [Phycisphaerae bacterium]
MKAYEGMFLFDPAAAVEWSNVEAEVNRLLGRASAELIACKRWDERRLAYEIRGRKRGFYVLTYFRAPTDRIAALERDVQLSEQILRCLIIRVDHMTDEEMKEAVNKTPEPMVETERGGRGRWRRDGDESGPRRGGDRSDYRPRFHRDDDGDDADRSGDVGDIAEDQTDDEAADSKEA